MGNYLDYLIRQPQPIREQAEILPANSPHLLSVPKEIWRLVDAISKFTDNVNFLLYTFSVFFSNFKVCFFLGQIIY